MAAGSLLALLDDIATILDDVSVMTQVAAKKTAGVLGDDLALNAQQVSGVHAERELPVVWAVAKGSFLNKLILVPSALAVSYFVPWLITPLLMAGGAYLCFEGFEKVAHKLLMSKHDNIEQHTILANAITNAKEDLVVLEKEKIKGAIRTDFILSAEIIVIALGTVAAATFSQQASVVAIVAIVMTVGVYGLVACIVKLDDLGLYLMLKKGKSVYRQIQRKLGKYLLAFAPKLMRTLSVVGTLAMFMVGGSIIGHGIPAIHHWSETMTELLPSVAFIASIVVDALVGLIVGAVCLGLITLTNKILPKKISN
ncbi:Inner membrane protein YedI [Methylophilaceae bacterium]